MRRFLTFVLVVITSAIIYSCAETGPANIVENNYILEDNNLSINDIPVLISDYPNASIEIVSENSIRATLFVRNIILGYDELPISCLISQENAADIYSFEGSFDNSTITVTSSGMIQNGVLSINLSILRKDAIVEKWMFGEKTVTIEDCNVVMPDAYIQFSPPADVSSISFQNQTYNISELIENGNIGFMDLLVKTTIESIEFTPRGYINFTSYEEEPPFLSFNNMAQFFSTDTLVTICLRKSLLDGINQAIQTKGSGLILPSPINISFKYTLGGTKDEPTLSLVADKSTLNTYVSLIRIIANKLTLEDITNLDYKVTQEEFDDYKALTLEVLDILSAEETSYEIGINLIKYKEVSRPWFMKRN